MFGVENDCWLWCQPAAEAAVIYFTGGILESSENISGSDAWVFLLHTIPISCFDNKHLEIFNIRK